jgi:hypothetical protein
MSTRLSFRKESIQQSSGMSAALSRVGAAPTQGQGPKHDALWFPPPTLTTSFTTLQ